ncbi:vitamin K epoxide reductase family protein [Microbacterium invictum]|uniref:Membrane protein n=1 Tax=Microbacterium invictum TaxID=515415 RepID=A0AA40SQ41_9MICO|nr:vitamin K epoxide reductase family protein [Microbacterium invictum]MBB4140338.1 putative membrane protein [Microbacterium invictum]
MSQFVGREFFFGLFLMLSGAIGLTAAMALSIEKIEKLTNPDTGLSCDFSVLVQCSANLDSAQGAALGVPNPFLGLVGFALVVCVGVTVWAVPHFARWFWMLFNIGVAGAFGFVVWLIGQSIYVLGTLCPWCLVVWLTTLPLFFFVTARNLREGVFGRRARRVGALLWPWMTLVTVAAYLVVAVLAQLRLNVLASII